MTTNRSAQLPSSFRDPAGFLFHRDGVVYRQLNVLYRRDYDHLMTSGLYQALVQAGMLIPHEETDMDAPRADTAYKVIRPEQIPFVSYPYEWCLGQLRDAALMTLGVQRTALQFNMSLKDSSGFNIQFRRGKPVFIDTLSFAQYQEGQPWIAYRQFCQHFLAPLALMAYKDVRLNQLLRIYVDGLPLDLASSLLPVSTRFRFSLLSHIHLHARSQAHFADRVVDTSGHRLSRLGLLGIIDNLESAIRGMKWQPGHTEWAEYYEDTNYSAEAFEHKRQVVAGYLDTIKPTSVWDLGANAGILSRLASDHGTLTISIDSDAAAVEKNYREVVARGETHILPLTIDLSNPSSGIGWENRERMSLVERGPADVAMALALIHHLAISNNLPLGRIASFLADVCHYLIIEFVPKDDSQVQRLLRTREDIFADYTRQAFENEFCRYFTIEDVAAIRESQRTLYRMRHKQGETQFKNQSQ